MKNISWRVVIVFAVIVTAIVYLLPTISPALWPHKKINLGLDLQGGMHLVLEVDTDKAVEGTIERINQEIRSALKKEHLRYVYLSRIEGNRISIKLRGQKNIDGFDDLRGAIRDLIMEGDIDPKSSQVVPNMRHKRALKEAFQFFKDAALNTRENLPMEIIAADLNSGLEALGEIIGETTNEDILEMIFKEFCLGK